MEAIAQAKVLLDGSIVDPERLDQGFGLSDVLALRTNHLGKAAPGDRRFATGPEGRPGEDTDITAQRLNAGGQRTDAAPLDRGQPLDEGGRLKPVSRRASQGCVRGCNIAHLLK